MRLIDADELERMCENPEYTLYNGDMLAEWMKHCIVTAPTIEAEPVRRGRWNFTECSLCDHCFLEYADADCDHSFYRYLPNYCPNCGARMDRSEA